MAQQKELTEIMTGLSPATATELTAGQLLLKIGDQMKTLDGSEVAKSADFPSYTSSDRDNIIDSGIYYRKDVNATAILFCGKNGSVVYQTEIYSLATTKVSKIQTRYYDGSTWSSWVDYLQDVKNVSFSGVYDSSTRDSVVNAGIYVNTTASYIGILFVSLNGSGETQKIYQNEMYLYSSNGSFTIRKRMKTGSGSWGSWEDFKSDIFAKCFTGVYNSSTRDTLKSAGTYINNTSNYIGCMQVAVNGSLVYQTEYYSTPSSPMTIRTRVYDGSSWGSWEKLIDDSIDNSITFYKASNGYVSIEQGKHTYVLSRDTDSSRNVDVWRVVGGKWNGENLWNGTDIEGPIREVGEGKDWIGGTHGNEIQSSVKFYVDGTEIDFSSAIAKSKCKRIDVYVESSLYDNVSGSKVFNRNKHLLFIGKKVIVNNTLTCVADNGFRVSRYCGDGLYAIYISKLNSYSSDSVNKVENLETEEDYDNSKRKVTYHGKGFVAEIKTLTPHHQNHCGFTEIKSDKRMKAYLDFSNENYKNFSFVKNQTLSTSFEIEVK